jgi:ketosteroid isomerase-like protein
MTHPRYDEAREVVGRLGIGEHWNAVIDPDMPADLDLAMRATLAAYERADLDFLIAGVDPEIEIEQPPELPDARSYRGRDGLVDALLDWPRQWDDFRMEPRRIFAPNEDHIAIVALHHGRPHSMDIEVEAEFIFLLRVRDGLLVRWDMFMSEEDALRRAAEGSGHRDDDRPAEGDGGEGAQEAGPEEARADHG